MDTENHPIPVKKSLRHSIRAELGGQQIRSQLIYSLMVGAVGYKGGTIEGRKKCIRKNFCKMNLIPALIGVSLSHIPWQILDKASPQGNVNELHALADAKDWLLGLIKGAEQMELQEIQQEVHLCGALILLSKELRINIPAAGEE